MMRTTKNDEENAGTVTAAPETPAVGGRPGDAGMGVA